MIQFSEDLGDRFSRIADAQTDTFSDLVKLADLNPSTDFVSANLSGVDFTGSELNQFDFSFADLRGATWGDLRKSAPLKYVYALRGHAKDQISGLDYTDIFDAAIGAKTWGERFFAFALALDNFGPVNEVATLLDEITKSDKSKYMRYTSVTYFLAVLLNNPRAMDECKTMASMSNAYSNMYRFVGLTKQLRELLKYGSTIRREMRIPGEVDFQRVSNLITV